MSDELTASEAVYGLLGWLTTRDEVIELGSSKLASPAADAAAQLCKENGLDDPRDGWENNLIHPSGECTGPVK